MKKLIASTALASVLALSSLPAVAQTAAEPTPAPDATAPATPEMTSTEAGATAPTFLPGIQGGLRASDFIGKDVWVTEADTTGMSATAVAEAGADWQDVGEINDLIITLSGDTEAVLVDVGGFLGIGAKTVALSLSELTMVPDSDSPDDYFIVFHGSKAALEAAPEFDPNMVFEAKAAENTDNVVLPADQATVADPAAAPAEAMPVAPGETLVLDSYAETDLIGKRVLGPNDEDLGEISAVKLNADGKVEAAVVDVGGFLGIGEKRVALDQTQLMVEKTSDGEVQFRTMATEDQLKAMADYQG